MGREVADIITDLRRDHRNISILLDLIEREADKLFDDGDVDFELLHDILRYMTVYPDAVHHPKEDLLYNEIRKARPDLSNGFKRISADHRELASAGRLLRDNLEAIDAGAMVERKAVVAEALRYVNKLRSHMRWEETDLFNRCLKMARDGHQFVAAAETADVDDPLFGDTARQGFERLYRQIIDSANPALRESPAGRHIALS